MWAVRSSGEDLLLLLELRGTAAASRLTTTSAVLTAAERAQIQSSGSASAQALLQFIPAANGTLNGAAAFFGSASANVNIDQGTVDISHNFSDKDRIHGYYANQEDLRLEPTQGANLPGFGDTRAGRRQVFTLGETHVFSPLLINEFVWARTEFTSRSHRIIQPILHPWAWVESLVRT